MNQKWTEFLNKEKQKDYMKDVLAFVKNERLTKTIYPEHSQMVDAMKYCDYYDLKIVILGTEPSSAIGAANGLAFGTNQSSPSIPLSNILKEIRDDVYPEFINTQQTLFKEFSLRSWAKQGVLLWNTILTSEKGVQLAHKHKGWEQLTVALIEELNHHPFKLVYMLWGKTALSYEQYIDKNKHEIFRAPHPGPHTAQSGFFGCKHFSRANRHIANHYFNQRSPITWAIV